MNQAKNKAKHSCHVTCVIQSLPSDVVLWLPVRLYVQRLTYDQWGYKQLRGGWNSKPGTESWSDTSGLNSSLPLAAGPLGLCKVGDTETRSEMWKEWRNRKKKKREGYWKRPGEKLWSYMESFPNNWEAAIIHSKCLEDLFCQTLLLTSRVQDCTCIFETL